MTINPLNVQTQITDLRPLFLSNDTYCEAVSYEIKTDNTADPADAPNPSARELDNFRLTSVGVLSVSPINENNWVFFILAKSIVGNFVYKRVEFDVTCGSLSQIIFNQI
jgi:hypothetical protein